MKSEIRIVGFDDGPFVPRSKGKVPLVGMIYRGGKFPDGVLKTEVEVDGTDATQKIIEVINNSRHKPQLKVIMLDGITVGGFNVVDIKEVYERTGIPVIVINRKKPNVERVKKALKKFEDFEARWKCIENAGEIKSCEVKEGRVYFQHVGIDEETAKEIIRLSATRSNIPEPLRVAHLVAGAIVKGESYGHA